MGQGVGHAPLESKKSMHTFNTLSEFHRFCGLPKPEHPLISLVNYGQVDYQTIENQITWMQNFYSIGLKRDIHAKVRYGQQEYDFDEGQDQDGRLQGRRPAAPCPPSHRRRLSVGATPLHPDPCPTP